LRCARTASKLSVTITGIVGHDAGIPDLHHFRASVTISGMTGHDPPEYPTSIAPPGGHYSHAAVAGGLVFVSGQLPITFSGEKLNDASFEEQALQTLANVHATLEAAGSSVAKLLQVGSRLSGNQQKATFSYQWRYWRGLLKSEIFNFAGCVHRSAATQGKLKVGETPFTIDAAQHLSNETFKRYKRAVWGFHPVCHCTAHYRNITVE
jgi:enamine deaminase RidA (YjgF/YER057c/UK114 family)